jgi:hypothetical protein
MVRLYFRYLPATEKYDLQTAKGHLDDSMHVERFVSLVFAAQTYLAQGTNAPGSLSARCMQAGQAVLARWGTI